MKEEAIDRSKTLVGCVLAQFFIAGASGASSLYFIETINQYNADRKQASFPFVMHSLMYPLSGPIAGYLEQIFGIKVIMTAGCLLATISIGACYFAQSILAITVLYGILFGLGHGFSGLLVPSLLNKHFSENKSKSNALSHACVSVGNTLMPAILEVCLQFYGFSGSFLIVSAIMAHSVPACLLCKIPFNKAESNLFGKNPKVEFGINENCHQHIPSELPAVKKSDIVSKIPCHKTESNFVGKNPEVEIGIKENCHQHIPNELSAAEKRDIVCKSVSKHSLQDLQSHSNDKTSSRSQRTKLFLNQLRSLRKFNIFLNPAYLLILIMTAGSAFMIVAMKTVIVDVLRDKQIDESLYVYYVMIMHASELVGHFVAGFIIDRHYCSYLVITSISFLSCGFFALGFMFFKNYIMVMICVIFISIFLASLTLLSISLVHEYIEDDKRTMGMSCRYSLHPLATLAIPYAIGYFRGIKGSYNGVLYLFAGITVFCAFVVHFIPYFAQLKQKTRRAEAIKNTRTLEIK